MKNESSSDTRITTELNASPVSKLTSTLRQNPKRRSWVGKSLKRWSQFMGEAPRKFRRPWVA